MTTAWRGTEAAAEKPRISAPKFEAPFPRRTRQFMLFGLLVFVFLGAFFWVSDADVGYHLRTAAYILETKQIPAKNTFSATVPDYPWMLQQWLGTIFFYLPFAAGGVKALITTKALVAVFILLLTWKRAVEQTRPGSWWSFWVVTVGVVAMRVRFFERPDLLSALFFATVLYCDQRWNNNRRWQWVGLPLVMALWANVHSGVIYGMVYLGAVSGSEWIGWFWKTRILRGSAESNSWPAMQRLFIRPAGAVLAVSLACLTVQLINPNGCRVLWVPISQFASPFWQSIIVEYFRPRWSGAKTFYCFLAGLVLLQVLTRKQANLRSCLVSLTFGYLALSSQRSILFFIIATAAHASSMLETLLPSQNIPEQVDAESERNLQPQPTSRMLNLESVQPVLLLVVWAAIVGAVFIPNQTFRFGTGWYRPYYPLEIYDFIRTQVPPQNTFNEMRYGGSMIWWLYPKFKPFIDGRGDAYSEGFWKTDYLPILRAQPKWQDTLNKYQVTAALLPIYEDRTFPPLVQKLRSDPDWALVAFNDNTLFFLRRTDTNHNIIAEREFRRIWPGDWGFGALDSSATREEATLESKRALEFSPDSLFAQTAVARAYFVSEQYGPAAHLLRQIVRQHDAGANYLRDFGYALYRLGQFEEADQVFARMIRENLLPGFAWYMRHFIALQEKRDDVARADLTQAIRIEPGNTEYREALKRAELRQPH